MNLLDTVKTLLGITDDSKDAILTLYIGIVTQSILNTTNRQELPAELENEVAMMVFDMFNELSNASGTTGKATSISEAGRSLSFDTSQAQLWAKNRLKQREAQIFSFRLPYRITERGRRDGL